MIQDLSTTEYAVLGVLAGGPAHGFALAKVLAEDGLVGRVFRVRRPLVYRALDRLVTAGYAEPVSTEQGDAGPKRVVHRVTQRGRRHLQAWLNTPVEHVRELRVDFLLKLSLLDLINKPPVELIRRQRQLLSPTLQALASGAAADHVELWRQHNAAAAATYLDSLHSRYTAG